MMADEFGCKHYRRRCQKFCEECQKFFPCRLCHDEQVDTHNFDRFKVKKIRCNSCKTEQSPKRYCEKCGITFAKYFCATCNLYDDDGLKKGNFHCEKCGICRTGGQENFFHCDKCGTCLAIALKGRHKCIEGTMNKDCVVCLGDMHSSTKPCI